MGYQSKTYSLSDEVVEAIADAKSRGVTPNQFLREALGLNAATYTPQVEAKIKKNVTPRNSVDEAVGLLNKIGVGDLLDKRAVNSARRVVNQKVTRRFKGVILKPKERK